MQYLYMKDNKGKMLLGVVSTQIKAKTENKAHEYASLGIKTKKRCREAQT